MAAQIGKQDSFPGPEWLIQAALRDLPRLDIFVYLHPGSQTIKTHLLPWKVGDENGSYTRVHTCTRTLIHTQVHTHMCSSSAESLGR